MTTAPFPDIRKAAAYGRISQDDLDRREGVDDQLVRAEAHIERRGWDLVDTFRDDDLSAYSGRPRPGYDALMAEVRAGRVDTIVVRHIDRLWRDDLEAAYARRVLQERRVLVSEYGGMDYPMWKAAGRRYARDAASGGTFESDVKGERVREAAERRAEQGRMNGPCPYGWRREYERTPSGRVIESREVVHEPEAEIVREITRRLLSGDSLLSVTADLNRRKVPSPGAGFTFRHKERAIDNPDGSRWSKTSVKKLVIRESNAALRVWHKGEPDERLVEGNWPALVTEDEWKRVVALLTAQERRVARPGSRQHLLTWGLGECGVCHGHLRMAHRTKARVPYYVCAAGCVGRRQDYVDALVTEVVVARLSEPDALDWLTPDDQQLADATRRAQEARDLLATAGLKLATGEWAVETVDVVTSSTRPTLEQAEAEIRRLTVTTDRALLLEVAGPKVDYWWSNASVVQRRRLLDTLRARVVILPTGRRGPGFDPNSVYIELP